MEVSSRWRSRDDSWRDPTWSEALIYLTPLSDSVFEATPSPTIQLSSCGLLAGVAEGR